MSQTRSVEIAARSVDEAIRLALEQLGRSRDEVQVEILADTSDQSDGEALVRVTPRGAGVAAPPAVRAEADRVDEHTEQVAKDVVKELIAKIGFACTVRAVGNPSSVPVGSDEPPTVFIDVTGQDLGMLIGRRGEHLAQLQYMVNVIVNKHLSQWTRVIVDIEGYRIRREESLVSLAQRVAKQVARNRRPISLEPMPPNERRVVHVALRDETGIMTQSSGEGALRRVTIFPK